MKEKQTQLKTNLVTVNSKVWLIWFSFGLSVDSRVVDLIQFKDVFTREAFKNVLCSILIVVALLMC